MMVRNGHIKSWRNGAGRSTLMMRNPKKWWRDHGCDYRLHELAQSAPCDNRSPKAKAATPKLGKTR
jgi:hypothetical protein